jgi:hypothetical protein
VSDFVTVPLHFAGLSCGEDQIESVVVQPNLPNVVTLLVVIDRHDKGFIQLNADGCGMSRVSQEFLSGYIHFCLLCANVVVGACQN